STRTSSSSITDSVWSWTSVVHPSTCAGEARWSRSSIARQSSRSRAIVALRSSTTTPAASVVGNLNPVTNCSRTCCSPVVLGRRRLVGTRHTRGAGSHASRARLQCRGRHRRWAGRDELACRPGSVLALRGATIHLGLPLPTASCDPPVSSGGPPSNAHADGPESVLLILLQVGFAEPPRSPGALV